MPFRNPVYPYSFPDPFVLKFKGEYWGFCTGFQSDGRVFGIIRSTDLVHWSFSGGAMEPLPGGFTCYWAPEVTYEDDGSFLMYYSVGNEENMVIRVARADHPAGPFIDTGHTLTTEPFAIDAHVFKDSDGSRYLFYATDFLEHSHIGTGTVCCRMSDPYHLEGKPQPVSRARYDWQVYDPKRENKGGVRWHTVEGPFVLKRKKKYFEMFSGGNWQNISYGVSYASSDKILSDSEWEQNADGEIVYPILRTIPEKVIGPGHNSVVLGPDNWQQYIIYHVWHNQERVLAIDKLDFVGDDLIVIGPTTTEQLGPIRPRSVSVWDDSLPTGLETTMESETRHVVQLGSISALVEFWVSLAEEATVRIVMDDRPGREFNVRLVAGTNVKPNVWVRARIELDGTFFKLQIGENIMRQEGLMPSKTDALRFEAHGGTVRVSPLELTRGFEELFDGYPGTQDLVERYWDVSNHNWELVDRKELIYRDEEDGLMTKKLTGIEDYELVINFKLLNEGNTSEHHCSVYLGEPTVSHGVSIRLNEEGAGALVIKRGDEVIASVQPKNGFDPFAYQQVRITKIGTRATVLFGATLVSELENIDTTQTVAIGARGAAAFDMLRITEIAGD